MRGRHSEQHFYEDQRSQEHRLFNRRSRFIKEQYPGDAEYIIETALDGFDVIEVTDGQDIRGMLTYTEGKDQHQEVYTQFGVILVDEEERGSGLAEELFERLVHIAKEKEHAYITAKADTPSGEAFLERVGFYEEVDDVNSEEYFRYDLE
ncbi:MAG: GNAT family N-acetyltransferase [Candidatus Magasanikbacteria bacterium]|uniref:N-acetyltransferase domain-containing protein n=1 Tax=Candidatus Magasanikbacteria bacterium CG10_big_fil_rev_8_21_14_0_10_38_6 TaxID=1974647 RepID=A0A2M6P0L5_9BACT|nr:GNAT family N-acetyltransferase [Candidatus Magasanikbacteria bacterium]PIR77241.1 MAG: hypothetical protein COU30_03515 [Candidatus Magasanikbacteria bacterium CG10_big_fil_rev_8_21_14_0_10_38_6]